MSLTRAIQTISKTYTKSARRSQRLLLLGLASPLALMAAPVWAQDTTPAAVPDTGTLVVTGSRVRGPNFKSISPINSITSEDLSQRGISRVEDIINTLPQAYADQGGGNRGSAIGASGTATINLRNLGNQRTLVLINGRRLMQGDPDRVAAQAPDINNIPAGLVERVDVVTGGASAVYGSDALAGVVNFVLKNNFEGLQMDASTGLFSHNNDNDTAQRVAKAANQPYPDGSTTDGRQSNISLTAGKNFADGRGNLTLFASYRDIESVGTSDRDFTTCNLTAAATGYTCALSSSTNPAQFGLLNPTTGAARGTYTLDKTTGNTLRTYVTADGFNNGNTYDLQAPDKKINFDAFGHFAFSNHLDVYGEAMYMHDEMDVRLSPTATFGNTFTINCDNPLLSAQERTLICTSVGLGATADARVNIAQRNVQGGPRHDNAEHTAYRYVLGARGDIGAGWRYDAYAQFGQTDYTSYLTNDFSLLRVAKALQVVTNAGGQAVCKSVVNGTDPACVPYNIFTIGGITQAQLDYVQNPAREKGFTREMVISGSISGDLPFGSPWAEGKIATAFGAEYREETLKLTPDANWQAGDVAGGSGAKLPAFGKYDVKEVFAEFRAPVVEDHFLIKSLSVEAGVRYSDYSTAGNFTTYKAGGDWVPVTGIRFRSSFQRAVRAPNLTELFAPQRYTASRYTDPCEGTKPTATLAQCQSAGLSAALYGTVPSSGGQLLGGLIGGNPNLSPETSDTTSFGIQINPSSAPRVSFSLDYFDILVKDLIGTIAPTLTMSQCIATGDPYYCSLIKRGSANGSFLSSPVAYVIQTNVNTGSLRTSGFDFAMTARQDLPAAFGHDLGSLAFNFSGTLTSKYQVQPLPAQGAYTCEGYFGVTCGQPTPKWRHRARLDWVASDALKLSGTWRFIRGTNNDKSSTSSFLAAAYQLYDGHLKSVSYFDLAASYKITPKVTLRGGINNIFDVDPPITASVGSSQAANGTFYAGMYDPLGRYMFVGVSAKF
jgi:iron complex outermembrane recepter protein